LPPRFLAGGEGADRRMREAFHASVICAHGECLISRENLPLIRLRHLLPQLKNAGGEGLSMGGRSRECAGRDLERFETQLIPTTHAIFRAEGLSTYRAARPSASPALSPTPPTASHPPPTALRSAGPARARSSGRR